MSLLTNTKDKISFVSLQRNFIPVFCTQLVYSKQRKQRKEYGISVAVSREQGEGQPSLKGPKHDQIECGFFYINQTSMGGDLGTRQKKNIWVGLGLVLPFITRDFCLSAVGYSAKKNKNLQLGRKKKLFQTASIFTCLALKGIFDISIFTLFKIKCCTVQKPFFSSVVAYSAKDFLALQPTALKIFQRCSLQR